MADTISQGILNALTDVDMPRLDAEPAIAAPVMVQGHRVPVHACPHCGTLVQRRRVRSRSAARTVRAVAVSRY